MTNCKSLNPATKCGSKTVIGPFETVNELVQIANTSEWESSRQIDLFILNGKIVSRDSVAALLKKHKNHNIVSVKSVVSSQGNQLDGITPRHILIESCVE